MRVVAEAVHLLRQEQVVLVAVVPAVVPQLVQEVQVPQILALVAVEPHTAPVLMLADLADLASSSLNLRK